MTILNKRKSIALAFRGFDVEPALVEHLMGFKASRLGSRGSPVKPGVETVLKRSFATFVVDVDQACRLDEMIPTLFSHFGGVENIKNVREKISPEMCELDFTLPVKYSDEQEGGFIPVSVIADLSSLRCSVSFSFV